MEGIDVEQDERARALADRFWEGLLQDHPLLGTMAGDERFDDRLPDPSEAGRARSEALHRGALEELSGIDRAALDIDGRTTLDVLEAVSHRALAELEHRVDFLGPASHLWGPGNLPAEIGSLQRADTPERVDRLEARLRAVPAFLRAMSDVAREGIAAGVTSPRVVTERAIAQVERLLKIAAENSPALMPVTSPAGRTRLAAVIDDVVNPSYAAYLERLRAYAPHATETIGLSALPGGAAMYETQILSWTTLPLHAQEVHDLGVERFEGIQAERFEVAARLGYASPREAIAARWATGEDTPASREALKALAEEQVMRSWNAAPAYFGTMPSTWCEVRLVEEFREADMPFAFYNAPTEDGSRPGVYYVNGYELDQHQLHALAAVTYHEAHPGHHFQSSVEQETPGRPALRRFGGLLAGSAFAEGWGLYSERLADEMGLYLDDWERLGMLQAQALRAARLITDSGIHALGWDRERAVAKLEEGGSPHADAGIEIDRYIAMPGQALSYMIGMIRIQEARAAAEQRHGAAFSLRDFHDRLLALGQLPLPALARELG